MALKGNLRDFSTTQLLNLINLARKSGTLTVEGTDTAHMAFREGKLIHAIMGANGSSSLAAVLQKSGKLSTEQSKFIQQRAKGTSEKHLGHLLIQAGYVTQSDIIQSVRQNTLETIYKLFTWAEGKFQFEANILPPSDRITIPIDLAGVIMEGSRRLQEWEELQDEIPNLDVALKFTDKPDARLRNINLTVQEWRVISFINPRNTIRQIGQANNLNEFECRRIVYGLLQAGIVEFVIKPKPKPATPKATGELNSDAPSRKATSQFEPAVKRTLVTRLIGRIRSL